MNNEELRPGDKVRLVPTDMANMGEALARLDGQVVFVAGAIPGEEVEADIVRRKRGFLEAKVGEVITPSPHRVEPPCPYFGTCGGCQFQHIDYAHQAELKRSVVVDQLKRIGGFLEAPVAATLPSDSPWGYRNHARFSVNRSGNLGFMERGSHRFLRIDECLLMHPWINQALSQLQGKCAETTQLSIRYGANTGESLVQPPLKSGEIPVASGQKFYHESLLGAKFRVSSPSFFQVNTGQAEKLAQLVKEEMALNGDEVVVDAYAGVATFAALFAPYAKKVVAIEESAAAVEDAKANLQGLDNVELVAERVETYLSKLLDPPDVVVLDPPRAGCHAGTISAILRSRPRTVVYVSCDPATLARDLRLLCDGGYTLEKVQPVDMFPQTYHIECVATLRVE